MTLKISTLAPAVALSFLLAGCHVFRGQEAPPAVPSAHGKADWRDVATEADRARLRTARAAWTQALGQAQAAGHGQDLAALGELADPDIALENPAPPPGRYRCRTIKIGAKSDGMFDFIAYPFFNCTIENGRDGQLLFDKSSGSQRQKGVLWVDTPTRLVFLGTIELGDERAPMEYGADSQRDLVGVLERVGSQRWRLALPYPAWESNLDLIELVPQS